jgi:hypothetical protein
MSAKMPKAKPHVRPGARGRKQSERAWNFQGFISEVGKAKEVGAAKLSDTELLELCAGMHGHIEKHYWVDCGPFFVEMWKRIEEKRFGEIRTKREACTLIGCSPRWAQYIIAGTAKKKGGNTADGAAQPTYATSPKCAFRTNAEYLANIRSYAERQLKSLWVRGESRRSRNIYSLLAQHFSDAGNVEQIDGLNSASEKEAA